MYRNKEGKMANNQRSEDDRNALSIAVQNGDLDVVKRLIDKGVDVNFEDGIWMRPIHYAAAYGRTEIFAKLAELPNITVYNSMWNCLDLAIDNNHPEIVLTILRQNKETLSWIEMMQTRTKMSPGMYDTPMRKLIRKMPEVAREVFNKCTDIVKSEKQEIVGEDKGDISIVIFNYTYLDDTNHLNGWMNACHIFDASSDGNSRVKCLNKRHSCSHPTHRLYNGKQTVTQSDCRFCGVLEIEDTDRRCCRKCRPFNFRCQAGVSKERKNCRFCGVLEIEDTDRRCCRECRPFIFPCQAGVSKEHKKIAGGAYSSDRNCIMKNHPLMIMVKSKRTELLDHPLVSALLKRKWTSAGLYFSFVNVLVYAVFLVLLTSFTLSIPNPHHFNKTFPSNISEYQRLTDEAEQISRFASFFGYAVIIFAVKGIFIEFGTITLMHSCGIRVYYSKFENICHLITCLAVIPFAVNTYEGPDIGFRLEWQWMCGMISAFLAWINLLGKLTKFEFIGVYFIMLFRIAIVFTRSFFVFSPLFVAFAIIFHLLFPNQDQFSNIANSFVKTTAMMIGEIDFGTTLFSAYVMFKIMSFLCLTIFMLFMTVVVANLLIGLALADIEDFKKVAGFEKKRMLVEFVLELETMTLRFNRILRLIDDMAGRLAEYGVIKILPPKREEGPPRKQRQDESFEKHDPKIKGWFKCFKTKFAESWNLTERQIKAGLTKEQDVTTAHLGSKIDALNSYMKTEMERIERLVDKEKQTKI